MGETSNILFESTSGLPKWNWNDKKFGNCKTYGWHQYELVGDSPRKTTGGNK